MRDFISSKMSTIGLSGIRKVNEKALAMEREGKTVIHFEIGRPDFDTPEYIKKAAKESLDRDEVFYTSNLGDMGLRKQIAEKLNKENHIPYTAENILVAPVWMNYVNVPKVLGAVPVPYLLKEENDYQMDLDEIRSRITDRTKALVMVTPNNPTGSVLSRETLEGLAKIAVEKDILIFADEVYERLLYHGAEHVSIASLPGMMERTFTLNGFSKAYSMTGWRLGYIAAPVEFIKEINKLHQNAVTCAPSFVQKAGIVALTMPTYFFAGVIVRQSNSVFTDVFRPMWLSLLFLIVLIADLQNLDARHIGGGLIVYFVTSLLLAIYPYIKGKLQCGILFIGRNTLPLFLFSPIFTILCKQILPYLEFDSTGMIFLFLSLIICISGSLAIAWAMDKINASKYFFLKEKALSLNS